MEFLDKFLQVDDFVSNILCLRWHHLSTYAKSLHMVSDVTTTSKDLL